MRTSPTGSDSRLVYDRALDSPIATATPRIVAVTPAAPFDRTTWSGASYHLCTALAREGVLGGAVGAAVPAIVDAAAKATTFWPERKRWVERYEYSAVARSARSWLGAHRAAHIDARPDVLLQIGAWYDFGGRTVRPGLRCSYHDCNLALFSRGWDFIADPSARHIRRMAAFERRVYDRMDLIFTMSEWLRCSFVDDFDQDPAKVVVVGSGANVAVPTTPPDRPIGPPRLLFIGLEFRRKGGKQLLEAFRALRTDQPDAELWIVGAATPQAEAEPGVRWLGRIDRSTTEGDAMIGRLYREATAFVLPSLFEPFGIVFLEAMAHGLPCIGTTVGGIPEIIENGHTGYVVPPNNVDALFHAVLDLVGDPTRAKAMGAAGHRRVLGHFTWDRVVERMLGAIAIRLGTEMGGSATLDEHRRVVLGEHGGSLTTERPKPVAHNQGQGRG